MELLQEINQARSALRDNDSKSERQVEPVHEQEVEEQGDTSRGPVIKLRNPDSAVNYHREKSLVVEMNKKVRMSTCMVPWSACVLRAGGEPAQRRPASSYPEQTPRKS